MHRRRASFKLAAAADAFPESLFAHCKIVHKSLANISSLKIKACRVCVTAPALPLLTQEAENETILLSSGVY